MRRLHMESSHVRSLASHSYVRRAPETRVLRRSPSALRPCPRRPSEFPLTSAEIDAVLRILVAHGDEGARTRLCEELERAGFLVCAKTAHDGEALDAVVRERPDVSVLGAAPGVSVIALPAQIKEAHPKTKVVLINALADEEAS